MLFGRLDKLEAGIKDPYKVQGAVTSYEVIESDLDIDSDNSGCFIATTAGGSVPEPPANILREFRDRCLLPNRAAGFMMNVYYKYAPPLAKFIASKNNLRSMTPSALLPLVGVSRIALKLGGFTTTIIMILFGIGLFDLVRFKRI